MPGAAGLGLLWQLRMTARAQTYFNSWMHLLRDAAGIGTLETGWDGEGNCWRSSQHHVLVEMRFVPGAGRAQRGAAAWPWCGRECTQLTHTDTTDTQHHTRPAPWVILFPQRVLINRGAQRETCSIPNPPSRLGNTLVLTSPSLACRRRKGNTRPSGCGEGKRDALSVLKLYFLIIIQGNKQNFHPAKAPSKQQRPQLKYFFWAQLNRADCFEPSLQQGPSGVKAF